MHNLSLINMKKRVVLSLIVLAVFIFFINIVYASCSSSSQAILKLSSQTNAHGEISGNYPVEICYDTIFGVQGIKGSCSGTNKILGLSSSTNAHAEIPSLNIYQNDVCYGSLECISQATSCIIPYELIVSLSSNTNAHLSSGNDYPIKICCKNPIPVGLGNLSWRNMIDQDISRADLNDSVKLVVTGENFQGKEINYTIYKERWWWFDKKMAESSSLGYTLWRAGSKADGGLESGSYYFKAVASDGSTSEETSLTLEISDQQNNDKPVAVIVEPFYGKAYKRTNPVRFLQASYDVDDPITTNWSFGDGTSSSIFNTTHMYSLDGQKSIVLEVKDERGLRDSDSTSILACGGSSEDSRCLFASIARPAVGEIITGREVNFNASSSYALLYTGTTRIVSCIGGLCPNNMTDGTQVGGPNWPSFSSFEFNWTFLERGDASKKTYSHGFGFGGAVFSKLFNQPASMDNPHKALLTVTIP